MRRIQRIRSKHALIERILFFFSDREFLLQISWIGRGAIHLERTAGLRLRHERATLELRVSCGFARLVKITVAVLRGSRRALIPGRSGVGRSLLRLCKIRGEQKNPREKNS